MLKQNDKILCRIERKVLDPHAEVVHDEPRLARDAAGQPRCDELARRAELLERLREQPPDELVGVAVSRERDGRAAPGAQGSPRRAPLEQQI